MTISFDRSICCDLNETISREWLVTNGLGGYAAGTVAGVLTRMQHGLLVAMSPNAVTPQLLLAKIDEEIFFDQRTYYLGTNEYRDGTLSPAGFVHLEAFRLEEGIPTFTYRLGGIEGILLEKRIWMAQRYNTTYIQYRAICTTNTEKPGYRRSDITGTLSAFERRPASQAFLQQTQCSLTLKLLPLVANRPHNKLQCGSSDAHYRVQMHYTEESQLADAHTATVHFPKGTAGCIIWPGDDVQPYHLLAVGHSENQVTFLPTDVWYRNFLHRQDRTTDDPATDDLYLPGVIRATLWPNDEAMLTVIVSSEEISSLPTHRERLSRSYYESVEYQRQLTESLLQPQRYFGEAGEAAQALQLRVLPLATTSNPYEGGKEFLSLLLQASNHFLSQHKSPHTTYNGHSDNYMDVFAPPERHATLLANYYGMENAIRDILIALPGLLLVTGKYGEALSTLKGIARYFTGGILPDRLPTQDQLLTDSDYSSVDTTLWYFYALDYYLRITHNYEFLEEIFPHLKQCISRYVHGTYNGIRVDQTDGLLSAQKPGEAMTWMNAYIDRTPVTPRAGKPVEVNALWYHALSLMYEWSQYFSHRNTFGHNASYYQQLLLQCKHSFQQRFWYAAGHYLYDVVDGPEGDDAAIRPNQLLALSLSHPLLDMEYGQQVLETVTEHLLTPYGLRTLASREISYRGRGSAGNTLKEQQLALHQGCVWPWLIGPYLDTQFRMWSQQSERRDPPLFREYQWRKGLQLLEPFREHFQTNLLGTCGGIFDGDEPYQPLPRNQFLASATSIGELLRSYNTLAQLSVREQRAGVINVR
ncbi:MAG TPA: amylo-alpha-1,6-glucosidase [Ktedonobacteraceae bacterium]